MFAFDAISLNVTLFSILSLYLPSLTKPFALFCLYPIDLTIQVVLGSRSYLAIEIFQISHLLERGILRICVDVLFKWVNVQIFCFHRILFVWVGEFFGWGSVNWVNICWFFLSYILSYYFGPCLCNYMFCVVNMFYMIRYYFCNNWFYYAFDYKIHIIYMFN